MKESTFNKYCLIIDFWFTNGFNGTQSYLNFYPDSSYESADSSFRDIVEIPRIKEYIETKRSNTANELDITLSKQLKRLDDIIESSEEKATDKISAMKEQNKLLALYEEHNRQKTDLNINEKVSISFKKKK